MIICFYWFPDFKISFYHRRTWHNQDQQNTHKKMTQNKRRMSSTKRPDKWQALEDRVFLWNTAWPTLVCKTPWGLASPPLSCCEPIRMLHCHPASMYVGQLGVYVGRLKCILDCSVCRLQCMSAAVYVGCSVCWIVNNGGWCIIQHRVLRDWEKIILAEAKLWPNFSESQKSQCWIPHHPILL